jgi:hypothetical protein
VDKIAITGKIIPQPNLGSSQNEELNKICALA